MKHIDIIAQINSKHISDPRYTENMSNWVEFLVTRMASTKAEGNRFYPFSVNLLASFSSESSDNPSKNVRRKLDAEEAMELTEILIENGLMTKQVIFESPNSCEEIVLEDEDDINYYTTAWKVAKLAKDDFNKSDITKDELDVILNSEDVKVIDLLDGKTIHNALDVVSFAYEYTGKVDIDKELVAFNLDELKEAIEENLSEAQANEIYRKASYIAASKLKSE